MQSLPVLLPQERSLLTRMQTSPLFEQELFKRVRATAWNFELKEYERLIRLKRAAYPRDLQDSTISVASPWDCVHQPEMTTELLLELINMTSVDGDSTSQLRIMTVKVQQLSEVDTNPFNI